MLMNNKFKAQTLTGNPTGNYRCQLFASRALNMSCYFSQSARSIESRCVVNVLYGCIEHMSSSWLQLYSDLSVRYNARHRSNIDKIESQLRNNVNHSMSERYLAKVAVRTISKWYNSTANTCRTFYIRWISDIYIGKPEMKMPFWYRFDIGPI